ncbi:MAG: T9SS type A sorting domain-containing protein, partial [Chlorobi bacterium]|nr:T9SS type A sorting domain-containing protein [Chlorobiota bacterium]
FFIFLTVFFPSVLFAQTNYPDSQTADQKIRIVSVEDGKTLADFMDINGFLRSQSTDINVGIEPEGDYMGRSVFSTDGSKVFTVTGYTDNVTVFDFETMTTTVIGDLDNYPADIAVTDDYAIVGCLGSVIYVIDLSDYSIAETFAWSGDGQAVVVETSPDGNYAYVAFDVTHQLAKIDLVNMEVENTFSDFPVKLLTFSWLATGGRTTFQYSRFVVSPDGNYLIAGNDDNAVLFMDTSTGSVDYTVTGIPKCNVVGLSGDGTKTIAVSYDYTNSKLKVFQIDNATHAITGNVEITGYTLVTYGVGVNYDGSKAYLGVSNNKSVLVRFDSSDFVAYGQYLRPFWIGTSPDHHYVVHGQYNFAIFDFDNESFTDGYPGVSQSFGAVSPVDFKLVGYDPLRYEGIYFYDCSDPENIDYKGKNLAGKIPEGDTPYRIAVSPDGTKAVSVNGLSENISIIDLETHTVDTIMDMGENCWEVVITHDSQWGILGGYDLNTIKIVNLDTYEFVKSVYTGSRPMMLQVSPDDNYVYVGNLKGNSVSIVKLDGENSEVLKTIPTGVIGISYAAFGVKSGVELDPTGKYLLVAASFNNKVQVIDVDQQQIVADLPVGDFPLQIAFDSTGEYAAVTNMNSNNFSIIHVDGAASSVVGTYTGGGQRPLRLAYNKFTNEFGIINYDSKTVVNVDAQTGAIHSTDHYSAYGTPIQIKYDTEGKPLVLTMGDANTESQLVKNMEESVELPGMPTYFSYCAEKNSVGVCVPGNDNITYIEYNPAPIANFTADETEIEAGTSVQFTDLSQNDPTSWLWVFEGGIPDTSYEQNPLVEYDSVGTFDVSLTASNDYGSDTKIREDYITVDVYPFINDNGSLTELSVYPNPFSDKIYIRVKNRPENNIRITLFSLNGRLLISNELKEELNEINVKEFKAGVYILKIANGTQRRNIKLIKK